VVIPSSTPSSNLVVKTLVQGTGPEVKSGDLLVANYAGQVWAPGSKTFDSSFDRGVPAGFPIGVGQVIPGWDKALVGVKTGSRVVLVVPPAAGYGSAGQTSAGIKGTDTLVFVVDVLNRYDASARANGTPTSESLSGLPKVSGAVDTKPTVTVPSGTTAPTKTKVVIVDKGTGAPVKANSVAIAQYVAVGWDNSAVANTWDTQLPQPLNVGIAGSTSPFDSLIGVPVGSRVLMVIPAQSGQDPKTKSVAAVIDIVGNEATAAK
jgi:peptidylprolyl isomerase